MYIFKTHINETIQYLLANKVSVSLSLTHSVALYIALNTVVDVVRRCRRAWRRQRRRRPWQQWSLSDICVYTACWTTRTRASDNNHCRHNVDGRLTFLRSSETTTTTTTVTVVDKNGWWWWCWASASAYPTSVLNSTSRSRVWVFCVVATIVHITQRPSPRLCQV